jgi:hypothetical protein
MRRALILLILICVGVATWLLVREWNAPTIFRFDKVSGPPIA